jgi:hypothetical protein
MALSAGTMAATAQTESRIAALMTIAASAERERTEDFSFVVLSDRTGFARPGVFERAVAITNLMQPAFAVQVGDAIEGYTREPAVLDQMWAEFDAIVAALEVPYYRVPGNHDVGNLVMRDEWLRRHGALHYHFRYRDVLFLVIDTQDPPQPLSEMLRPVGAGLELPANVAALLDRADQTPEGELITELMGLMNSDPTSFQTILSAVKNGTQPARLSEQQVAEIEAAIAQHDDVRWSFLFMHMPAWQGDGHPGLDRIRRAFRGRPYTAFAGHCHNYQHTVIDGHDHIRLGTTGGARILDTAEGDFDHITWVSMTGDGPRIANIALDGVIGVEGGPSRR